MDVFYYDATYLLVLAGVILCVIASANVNQTYKKYSTVGNARHMTAEQAARTILDRAGISQVKIQRVGGNLADHYDPRSKVLRLSETVYGSSPWQPSAWRPTSAAMRLRMMWGMYRSKLEARDRSGRKSWFCPLLAAVPHRPSHGSTGFCKRGYYFIFSGGGLSACYPACGIQRVRQSTRILDGAGILEGNELRGPGKFCAQQH